MKNIIISIFIISLTIGGFFIFRQEEKATKEGYLRVHIRANSNLEADQTIKYTIKEYVVNFLTPLVKDVQSAGDAMKIINDNLDNISLIASNVLEENGLNYTAKAKLTEEYFPTRTYDETTLDCGFYDALIVELGEATGDNWWCVVYPPLCFLSSKSESGKVEYDSVIYNFIKDKMKKR